MEQRSLPLPLLRRARTRGLAFAADKVFQSLPDKTRKPGQACSLLIQLKGHQDIDPAMKPSGTHGGTDRVLAEADNQGTAYAKVVFGQESPYESPHFMWWRTQAHPKGNPQPPRNGEREKQ